MCRVPVKKANDTNVEMPSTPVLLLDIRQFRFKRLSSSLSQARRLSLRIYASDNNMVHRRCVAFPCLDILFASSTVWVTVNMSEGRMSCGGCCRFEMFGENKVFCPQIGKFSRRFRIDTSIFLLYNFNGFSTQTVRVDSPIEYCLFLLKLV